MKNTQIQQITIAIIVAGLFLSVSALWLSMPQALLVGMIALLVILWSNEALPMGVVSLLPIVLFPAFGIIDTKATASGYSNPIVFLFLGGFMLAIAVEKSGLHRWMAFHLLSLFPKSARGVIFALAFTSALLSSILSNTTTTLLLLSLGMFLSNDPKIQFRYLLAIAYGASIGGLITPIGTAPNLILLGFLGEKSLPSIPFIDWVLMVAPLAILMLIIMAWLLGFGIKNELSTLEDSHPPLTRDQFKILSVLGILMAILFVNAPIKPYWNGLGLSEEGVMLSAGLILFLPGMNLLDWHEDKAKIPFRIMFLFGAGFAIAKAFSDTGLADITAQSLGALAMLEPWVILLCVATLITFTTEITSNTALISVMLPVIYAFSIQNHLDSELMMLVATVCASYAFMLPIATPPNAIVMSSGVMKVSQMVKYGFILNLVGIVLIVAFAHFYWRHLI